jgi:hypothetical protein
VPNASNVKLDCGKIETDIRCGQIDIGHAALPMTVGQ